ncbi:MAG TPA: SDR family oxidoreductase [Pyrinomonadaceae bacterium]|nr:SDR family oxidoreductase [Pyrinomonadaceae bacterium]
MKILVTGATGYIGGRLIPKLLEKGYSVRVFVRDARKIEGRRWFEKVEVATGDLENREEISRAMQKVDAAFFLVHAMNEGGDFAEREKNIAENFAVAAKDVEKIIYLGGLLPKESVSEHLKSRAAVGEILRKGGRATEFRAGPIIGSGSASFEMVRYLTERIPVMIVPRWVKNDVQPVAVRNVIEYLVAALEREPLGIVDIGADVLPFRGMMETFAEVRGLKRIIIPVPVLTPLLSGLWVGLITPIPNSLAVPLVKGIINPVLADTSKAEKYFPEIEPMNYREAVALALSKIDEKAVETRWSGSYGDDDAPTYEMTDREGVFQEVRTVTTDASPASVYKSFTSIGGDKGWLAWGWAWKLRGLMDKIAGGPGLSRGRRHPTEVLIGEELDFWRVEDLKRNEFILLRAEMKVPGKAWLKFEAVPKDGKTQLIQTATFAPKGLFGLLYWYSSYPAHFFIFDKMAQKIVLGAEVLEGEKDLSEMPETI